MELNHDHPEYWAHRSMSTGDVVGVAETALRCGAIGWEHIDSSELLRQRAIPDAVKRMAAQIKAGNEITEAILTDLDEAGIPMMEAMEMILQGAE